MTEQSPYEPPKSDLTLEPERQQVYADLPSSPLSLEGLKLLYMQPTDFFSDKSWLLKKPEWIVVYVFFVTGAVMDRIDARLARQDVGMSAQASLTFLNESWLNYWGFVLGIGLVFGWIGYYVGGWWYGVRLEWSGAIELNMKQVRAVYIFQSLVLDLPYVLLGVTATFLYSDYIDYYYADEWWSAIGVLLFIFWSIFVSYKAASTYAGEQWKTRLWFLILPVLFYLVVIGAFGTAYWYMAN